MPKKSEVASRKQTRSEVRKNAYSGTRSTVEQQLAELPHLSREALQQRWQELFGDPAPIRVRDDLLRRIMAYRIQEVAYGGLKPAAVRQLRRLLENRSGATRPAASPTAFLKSGAKLMREWNGETHVVDVTASGFTWRGKVYRSLSVIAREITGTRWSGPRFFGLKGTHQ